MTTKLTWRDTGGYMDLEDKYGACLAYVSKKSLKYSTTPYGAPETHNAPEGITDLPTVMAYVETLVRLGAP